MFSDADSSSPLLQNLNPEQLAAVTLPATHALILAGAGSGKTRVLTTRIAWLLQTGRASPGGILAVTFTNKAAKEMLTRLSAMLPINVRGMWIGTFHGLCNRFLRAHYKLANLPSTFQILDTQDQLSAIKRLCKQFGIDDERFPPKDLMRFIAGCKEDGLRAKDVPAHDENSRKKVEIYDLYEQQCQREGVVDFGELMLRSYEVLRDNAPIREHYQRRFRHILIDEFQDTNKLQYAWIKMLAGQGDEATHGVQGMPGGSVIAVGDDDQSIYAFRGARVGNMADFVREFNVTHQIKLERNYRSFGNILDSANALISHNTQRLGKNLTTEAGPGEPVRVYESTSDFAEAQWFVDEVKQLVRDGTPAREIALLYRSNAQSRVMESALFNASIPYRVYGGLRFFERAEIKHALAYLRLLENPHDDTSFMRVVNFPPRGIGARSLEQLQDISKASGCSLHDGVSAVPGKAGANLGAFVAKLDVMREQTAGCTLREIIELVLQHSGLEEHYKTDKDGQDRLENLAELVNAAEAFVSQEGFGRDAVALPVDELGAGLAQSPASQGLLLSSQVTQREPDFLDQQEALNPTEDAASPLLAVVTVDKKDAVKCSCCSRPVYSKVHLVSNDQHTSRYGSACFEREFGKKFLPRYTTSDGKALDDERSELLQKDIEALVSWVKVRFFESKAQLKAQLENLIKLREFNQSKLGWTEQASIDTDTGETLSPLVAFLTHAALESGDNQAQAGQDAVQLMTVHSSKGLEFDCVFITGLEDGIFPHENALSDAGGIEEERRLMYVAITRARKRLYLSHSQTRMLHGQTRYNLKSRFFDELPESALKWITPKRQGQGSGGWGSATNSGAGGGRGDWASGVFSSKSGSAERFASPAVAQKSAPSHGLKSGMNVFHAKFGEGQVTMLEGSGDDARAQINFTRHGVKWLALSVAKLTVIQGVKAPQS